MIPPHLQSQINQQVADTQAQAVLSASEPPVKLRPTPETDRMKTVILTRGDGAQYVDALHANKCATDRPHSHAATAMKNRIDKPQVWDVYAERCSEAQYNSLDSLRPEEFPSLQIEIARNPTLDAMFPANKELHPMILRFYHMGGHQFRCLNLVVGSVVPPADNAEGSPYTFTFYRLQRKFAVNLHLPDQQ